MNQSKEKKQKGVVQGKERKGKAGSLGKRKERAGVQIRANKEVRREKKWAFVVDVNWLFNEDMEEGKASWRGGTEWKQMNGNSGTEGKGGEAIYK